jgi:hypothetical protein
MGNKNGLSSGFIKNWSIFWTNHSVLLETYLDKSLITKSKLIHCAAPIESPKLKTDSSGQRGHDEGVQRHGEFHRMTRPLP